MSKITKKKFLDIISKKINQGWVVSKTENRSGYGTVDEILKAVKLYEKENNVKLYTRITESGNVKITDKDV